MQRCYLKWPPKTLNSKYIPVISSPCQINWWPGTCAELGDHVTRAQTSRYWLLYSHNYLLHGTPLSSRTMATHSAFAAKHDEDDLFQDLPPEQPPTQPPTAIKPEPQRGGYNCEFVERPPSDSLEQTDSSCPLCSLTLREPHQVTCCGYTFCQSCIQVIQSDQGLCPSCNQKFTAFADKRLKRSSMHVRSVAVSERRVVSGWVSWGSLMSTSTYSRCQRNCL